MIDDTFLRVKSGLELDDSFAETVSRQHKAVRSVVENGDQSVEDTKLIGSLHPKRQTRIKPRENDEFDIDILVILGQFDHWVPLGQGTTPQMAMDRVYSIVGRTDRYRGMGPQQDHPTITFEYANKVRVELVPAYRDHVGHSPAGVPHQPIGRGYWIPNSTGGWGLADYDYEAEYLSLVNQQTNGFMIPLVKMVKAIKRVQFPSLKSFHLEVIAAQVIPRVIADYKQIGRPVTYPSLVAEFIHRFEPYLKVPGSVPGSNSPSFQVDTVALAEVSRVISLLKQRSHAALMANTDADKHRLWRDIFGDLFPLS